MTLLFHEIKRNRLSLIIWTGAIAFMLAVCVVIYPEMSADMNELSDMFADMGAFSDAFGMDQLNFGEFMGYFGIECGNTLGLGGALFAAILGIGALAKEEKDRTAEFLLAHPVSRISIISQKFAAVVLQLLAMNLAVIALTAVSIAAIGVEADAGKLTLLFLMNFILQLEIASVTFGISAFIRRGGLGIGLGVPLMLYFLNIISNLSEELEVLKFISPYGYAESSGIVGEGSVAVKYLITGLIFAALGIMAAYWKYSKKDIS